jgi:hypothetical protein
MSLERVSGLFALWCVAMLILIGSPPSFSSASKQQAGMLGPGLALQMAHDVRDVEALLSDKPNEDREAMRTKQYEDFGFIAGYLCLFLALSVLLARSYPGLRAIAIIAALSGAGAAIFDVMENLAILRIVDVKIVDTTQYMVDAIHHASLAKWTLAFIALGLLSTYFLRHRNWFAKLVGGIDAAAGFIGLVSLIDQSLYPLLFVAALLLAAGLLAGAVVLLTFKLDGRQ